LVGQKLEEGQNAREVEALDNFRDFNFVLNAQSKKKTKKFEADISEREFC
jgi:hypothetical protein